MYQLIWLPALYSFMNPQYVQLPICFHQPPILPPAPYISTSPLYSHQPLMLPPVSYTYACPLYSHHSPYFTSFHLPLRFKQSPTIPLGPYTYTSPLCLQQSPILPLPLYFKVPSILPPEIFTSIRPLFLCALYTFNCHLYFHQHFHLYLHFHKPPILPPAPYTSNSPLYVHQPRILPPAPIFPPAPILPPAPSLHVDGLPWCCR